ncbi:DUF1206 domain-containing protein [Kineococcus rhizosphaerae]|uniref:Uncharacterized protein DUF1206 n=1 Tax=Kineococcus rhizosphaerae TaxID=559628 RepID=A0A2T0R7Y3_9ACTN|nr:DUF1206 domain-containing protein [Kineococcus rhizosphaerae]PRY17258.1 uncharacterized protein DUF1206 [Kineococcus rhizosphaerae]
MSGQVQHHARRGEQFARAHEDGLRRVGRAGVAAEGVVYLLVAWLAAQVALGGSGGSADSSGALAQIASKPFGTVLLVVLAVGFLALLAWQVVTVVTADKTSHRVKAVVKAVVAAALAVSCVKFATGSGTSSGAQQQSLTQRVLEAPGGAVLVVVAGLVVVGVGVALVVQGVRKHFEEKVSGSLSPALTALGVAGWVARGVAFGVLGALVVVSATGDTGKSRGLDAAFHEIAAQPFGVVLLLLVALGLAAYAVFTLATARRRVRA